MNPNLIDEINSLVDAIENDNGIAEALIRFSNQLIQAARDAAHEADLCLCGEHESCDLCDPAEAYNRSQKI